MPPFLPVIGLYRSGSQGVRVGGQTLLNNKVTYVDLGRLAAPLSPTVTASSEVSTTAPGLTKEKKYTYAVTALDAFGGETAVSTEATVETGKGTEASGAHHNEITVTWTPVPNATGYNVYRTKAGGAVGTEVLYATTTAAEYLDQGKGEEKAGVTPPVANNTYFNSGKGWPSPFREMQQHSAVGAYEVVGPITACNLEWAPMLESGAWALTIESEKVKIAKAKELRNRTTGTYQEKEVVAATISGIVSEAEKEKFVIVVYNSQTNVVEGVVGTNEASASLAKVIEKLTKYQQPLYLLKTVGTTKTVENVTNLLPNAPVIARV